MKTIPQEEKVAKTHILVVDDEKPIREVFIMAIEHAGYMVSSAGCGEEALEIIKKNDIDVVITDIQMPGLSGIDLLKLIKERYEANVIVMTGFVEDYTYDKIIELGASDFIHKPVRLNELMLRLRRVLNERALMTELKDAYLDTVNRLVLAAEYKDEDTGDHIIRMSRYSALLSRKSGMGPDEVQTMLYSSPMHDIGKIGIPDSILLKKGKLTSEEFDIMKNHTSIGGKILEDSRSRILESARVIAITHHEKWNGKGYPAGLKAENIPLSGRIVALTDTFDALTSRRPYKDPYPLDVACDIIAKSREQHFDPELTDIFLDNIDEFWSIRNLVGAAEDLSATDFVWSERDLDGVRT